MPERIQRRRTKGWRMPDGAVYVGRPGIYGNPFNYGTNPRSKAHAVATFREWITLLALDPQQWGTGEIQDHVHLKAALERGDLRGLDLCCWCPLDHPCHADVLIELANPNALEGK
jgi:hypothetical protein